MNRFDITDICIRENRIEYEYTISGEWKKYFDESVRFWVEYDQDITGIPLGLAAVPLISNVIVLAAIFHAKITTPYIDQAFYEAVPEFMTGFVNMYPQIDFQYEDIIEYEKMERDVKPEGAEENTMLYFSGGVDAYTSLIRHEKENLILLTVCGADTWYSNKKGFEEIMRKNKEIAKLHNLRLVSLVSTLRKFINEKEIYEYINPLINDNFWHGFQHGIGMFGLVAGYVYLFHPNRIYFASSYSEKDDEKVPCGSDPTVDNYVRIGEAAIVHDGYELSRQDKVAQLCKYKEVQKKPIKLRVCYRSAVGENCCECEKCVRTIFSILAEGYRPVDFGFDYDEKEFWHRFIGILKRISNNPHNVLSMYGDSVEKFKKCYRIEELPDEMKVFWKADLSELLAFCQVPEEKTGNDFLVKNDTPGGVSLKNEYNEFCLQNNKTIFNVMCKEAMTKYEVHPAQNTEYWIGNHGFVLDPSADTEVKGGEIHILPGKKETVQINGWAADFIQGKPLADLFVKAGRKYYPLSYGMANPNLGKRFGKPELSDICFRGTLPMDVMKKTNTISFVMVGYDEGTCYRYPEIKYHVIIEKQEKNK